MPDQPLTGHNCPGDPCTIVIFGASGDLTKRKLLPALYNLKVLRLLPQNFSIIGVAVTEGDDESYRAKTTADIKEFATRPVEDAEWEDFRKRSYYLQGDFNDIETFKKLENKIAEAQTTWNLPGNVLFYLAITRPSFKPMANRRGKEKLVEFFDRL